MPPPTLTTVYPPCLTGFPIGVGGAVDDLEDTVGGFASIGRGNSHTGHIGSIVAEGWIKDIAPLN